MNVHCAKADSQLNSLFATAILQTENVLVLSQPRSYTTGSTIWVNNPGSNQTCTLYYCCKGLKIEHGDMFWGHLSVWKNK